MSKRSVTLLTGGVLFLTVHSHALGRVQQGQQDVDRMIEKLWSSDDERLAAKEELGRLGPRIIGPLQLLLEEMISNFRSRYQTGKEQEVADGREWYQRAKDGGDFEEQMKALEYLGGFEITSRLKQDALDLLVSQKAEIAAPQILQLTMMGPNYGGAGKDVIRPEMRALIEMGSIAVSRLVEFLMTARAEARRRAGGNPTNSPDTELLIESNALFLQHRAIIVLGRIGDSRAIPALERLLVETRNGMLKPIINRTILEIRDRNRLGRTGSYR